ncbi:hypothetical protein BHE74_00027263, partial [Ensete ventricosum]
IERKYTATIRRPLTERRRWIRFDPITTTASLNLGREREYELSIEGRCANCRLDLVLPFLSPVESLEWYVLPSSLCLSSRWIYSFPAVL